MKFYKIENSINTKEIGIYPQIEEAEYNCDPFEDDEFIENVGHKEVGFRPKLPIGKLHKKAKLTDFLSAVPNGYTRRLLISDKLKNHLPNGKNYQLFKAKIKKEDNNIIDYWLLNPISFDYDSINFDESEFYLITSFFSKGDKLSISSSNDMEKEKERINNLGYPNQLHIEKVILSSEKNKDLIIIDNTKGGISYFVSEKLKNEIESNNITGIMFEEI